MSNSSGPKRRWPAKLMSAVFILAIAGPALLTLVGLRPQALENRPPAPLPELSASALRRADTYAEIGDYLSDRLAIRSLAIRLNARIDNSLFGARSDDVIVGADGWLYYRNSLIELCRDALSARDIVLGVESLATVVEQRGASFTLVMAPAKPWVYPEYLPSASTREADCAEQARREIRAELERLGWYSDLYPELGRLAAASSEPIYHPRDTHWTQLGSLVMVEELVDSLAPGQYRPEDIMVTGTRSFQPDLVRLLGLDHPVEEASIVVQRADIEVEEGLPMPIEGERSARRFTTSGDAATIEGRTVMIYDSFTGVPGAFELLAPHYRDITFVHWDTFIATGGVRWLVDADHVMVEVAEREIANRVRGAILESDLLASLGS